MAQEKQPQTAPVSQDLASGEAEERALRSSRRQRVILCGIIGVILLALMLNVASR